MSNQFNALTATPSAIIRKMDTAHNATRDVTATLTAVMGLTHEAARTPEERALYMVETMQKLGDDDRGTRRWNSFQKLARRAADNAGFVIPNGKMVRRPSLGRYEFPLELEVKPAATTPAVTTPAVTPPASEGGNETDETGTAATTPVNPPTVADIARDAIEDASAIGATVADLIAALAETMPATERAKLARQLADKPAPRKGNGEATDEAA